MLDSFPNIMYFLQEFDIGADHNIMPCYFLSCVSFMIEPQKIIIVIMKDFRYLCTSET